MTHTVRVPEASIWWLAMRAGASSACITLTGGGGESARHSSGRERYDDAMRATVAVMPWIATMLSSRGARSRDSRSSVRHCRRACSCRWVRGGSVGSVRSISGGGSRIRPPPAAMRTRPAPTSSSTATRTLVRGMPARPESWTALSRCGPRIRNPSTITATGESSFDAMTPLAYAHTCLCAQCGLRCHRADREVKSVQTRTSREMSTCGQKPFRADRACLAWCACSRRPHWGQPEHGTPAG